MDSEAQTYQNANEPQPIRASPRPKWLRHGHNKSTSAPPPTLWTTSLTSLQDLFSGRRKPYAIFVLFIIGSLSMIYMLSQPSSGQEEYHLEHPPMHSPPIPTNETSVSEPVKAVRFSPIDSFRGPPTIKYKDNLRPDTKYITGWANGGFTNDFMTYVNLIYLAQLSGRVPVIPPHAPLHIGYEAGYIPFGDVWDLPKLRESLNMPIVEWRDLKEESAAPPTEYTGCWSLWGSVGSEPGEPRYNILERNLSLEISYTLAPKSFKLMPLDHTWDFHMDFWKVASLGFPKQAAEAARENAPIPTPWTKEAIPPDDHLLCFDFMYYLSVVKPFEWDEEYSPEWNVASQIHFAPRLHDLGRPYLRRAFGLDIGAAIPPFISIHVRRGDFKGWCNDVPVNECQAPLSAYVRRVQEVQDELAEKKGLFSLPVLLTSDESDPEWWAEVKALGWHTIDHGPDGEDTTAKLGAWYGPLLDALFQSMGAGFVGTDRSTMSLIAQRRVEDWQGGPTRAVVWGHIGADDH